MAIAVVLAVMDMESHGGVADQITNLALELPKHGVTPTVVIRNPLSRGHIYAALLREAGISVYAVRHEHYQAIRWMCKILSQLALPIAVLDAALRKKTLSASRRTVWGVLRRLGYAGLDLLFGVWLLYFRLARGFRLIHFRKPDSWPWIGRAERLAFATIYTEDTIPSEHTIKYYQGLASVASSIRLITAVSRASSNAIRPYLPEQTPIRVIPNMVRATGFSPAEKPTACHPFVVGQISRLDPPKDIVTLLLAARRTVEDDHRVQFRIFGDGPLRDSLELLTHNLGLRDYVQFRGAFAKTDLPAIMNELDLVVLSTHYEGFGVALVEGMAYGKPVIATAVDGVIDVVENGVTGILVPKNDSDALAKGILTLSHDWQLYQRMARAGHEQYLARFTPGQVTPQYVTLYKRLAQ